MKFTDNRCREILLFLFSAIFVLAAEGQGLITDDIIGNRFDNDDGGFALIESARKILNGNKLSPLLEEKMISYLARHLESEKIVSYVKKYGVKTEMTSTTRVLVAWAADRQNKYEMSLEYLDGLEVNNGLSQAYISTMYLVKASAYAWKKDYSSAIKEVFEIKKYASLGVPAQFALSRYYLAVHDKERALCSLSHVREICNENDLECAVEMLSMDLYSELYTEKVYIDLYGFVSGMLISMVHETIENDSGGSAAFVVLLNKTCTTGVAIYDKNIQSNKVDYARAVLETFDVYGCKCNNFYIKVISECLNNNRSFDALIYPLIYIMKEFPEMGEDSKNYTVEELRAMCRKAAVSEPEIIDRLNLTWYYNVGQWLFDTAFSNCLLSNDGHIDKKFYEERRKDRVGTDVYLLPK